MRVGHIVEVKHLHAINKHSLRSTAIAPRDSRRLCAAAGTTPITVSPWSKIGHVDRPRQHVCKRRYDRIPKVGKLPAPSRHRSPTLSQTVRGSRHSPITVSRWLKICPIDRPRKHGCKHRCGRIPKVGKLPAPSRHRSPTLSHTVRASRYSPITVSPWSKIGHVDRPRQHVCMHRYDRITQDQQTAHAVAQSLPDTLAPCARQPAQSHHRFSMVENRPRRPPAPTCVQAS